MTSEQVIAALREKFQAPTWAFFEELRNGTGFARGTDRTADAVAMGLWPSRGLELFGFEVKLSKGDLKRELVAPEKAESIARFCDRWWLAVAPGVIDDLADIPPAWGVLEYCEAGKKAGKLTTRHSRATATATLGPPRASGARASPPTRPALAPHAAPALLATCSPTGPPTRPHG